MRLNSYYYTCRRRATFFPDFLPLDASLLSLKEKHEAKAIVEDHQAIADAVAAGSIDQARAALTHHLSRLDRTIQEIHEHHAHFFE